MRSTMTDKLLAMALAVPFALAAVAPIQAQDRVIQSTDRSYFDARISPDGKWLSYQADGSLRIQPSSGGGESLAYTAGRAVSYLWESGSTTLLVTTGDRLYRVTRDGLTQRQLANLSGQNVLDLYGIAGNWVYLIRRSGTSNFVARVQLTTGKLEDIITNVTGVTSLDIDSSGSTLLLSNTVFLFQYNFWRAKLDGSGLAVITGTPLTALARNARWLETDKTVVFEHVGTVGNYGGGWQLWKMDGFNGNASPIAWQPRYRRGTPAVSPDGKWVATFELLASGDVRALVMPSLGGSEFVLSPALKGSDSKIAWSPDSKTLVYTGTTDPKRKSDLRLFTFDRPLRLAPAPRPGTASPYTFELTKTEAGVVFLGVRAATPIPIPGLSGALELDLVAFPPLVLASAAGANLAGAFAVPNQTSLVGLEVTLQGLRLDIGKGLSGSFDLPCYVTITP